jgi:hypothetical protein
MHDAGPTCPLLTVPKPFLETATSGSVAGDARWTILGNI